MEDENLEQCIMTKCRLSASNKQYIKAGVKSPEGFQSSCCGNEI